MVCDPQCQTKPILCLVQCLTISLFDQSRQQNKRFLKSLWNCGSQTEHIIPLGTMVHSEGCQIASSSWLTGALTAKSWPNKSRRKGRRAPLLNVKGTMTSLGNTVLNMLEGWPSARWITNHIGQVTKLDMLEQRSHLNCHKCLFVF